jgi:predicted transposase YbfD/YdcC
MRYILKKTVEQIITSGNHYLIAVKANQPKLFASLQEQFEHQQTDNIDQQTEYNRGRKVTRTVRVLSHPRTIDPAWIGIQSLIQIRRQGTRAAQPFSQTVFYICSLSGSAAELAERIRQHWHVENRLHWVKDVVLKEDSTPVCDGHAMTNFAIVRTIALNLFRQHGFDSITQGIRRVAHDIPRLFSFFQ